MELESCREFKAMFFTNKNGTRENENGTKVM